MGCPGLRYRWLEHLTVELSFVRKNMLTLSVVVTPATGSSQPDSVTANLSFRDINGISQVASVPLTLASGVWTGEWDSTAAGQGIVYWVVYGTGTVQPAAQGQFNICANAANNV